MSTEEDQTLFDKCLEKLKNATLTIEVNVQTLMTIARYAMEIVELTKLKGKEQQTMVLKLLTQTGSNFHFLYVKLFGQEIFSLYSYAEGSNFNIQIFNKKVF